MYPDLPEIIYRALLKDRREPTGKLHCSSDSWQPLRFTQLKQVTKPTEDDYGSLMTMKIGTLTHDWLEDVIAGDIFCDILGPDWSVVGTELDLTEWLPTGWTGTCDYLFQHVPTGKYVVGDLKTAKPESLAYLNGKPKKEHTTQVSCYHAALTKKFGQEALHDELFVCYLPKGKTARQETVMPLIVTAPAEPSAWVNMVGIGLQVKNYVWEVERTGELNNKYLAPMPAPEPKIGWNRAQSVWDVTLRPSWTEEFIGSQFGEALCPKTPSSKIGHYTPDGWYVPRKGMTQPESIPPMPEKKRY